MIKTADRPCTHHYAAQTTKVLFQASKISQLNFVTKKMVKEYGITNFLLMIPLFAFYSLFPGEFNIRT